MEWILAKDMKNNNKEGFYKYIGQKRKAKNMKGHW